MSADPSRIAIDTVLLGRSADTLRDVATGLATVAHTISGTPLSGHAFGAMNAWMTPAVHAVSNNSAELVRVSGNVVEVLASATDAAAHDFNTTEGDVLLWVEQLDQQLLAGMAPVPPAPTPTAPLPVPSPSPNPAPIDPNP